MATENNRQIKTLNGVTAKLLTLRSSHPAPELQTIGAAVTVMGAAVTVTGAAVIIGAATSIGSTGT